MVLTAADEAIEDEFADDDVGLRIPADPPDASAADRLVADELRSPARFPAVQDREPIGVD